MGYQVISKSKWEALKSQCDFIDYIGEMVHHGEILWQMQVSSTDRVGRVVYDNVVIDPKWH